jgi:hypothetical protein
MFMFMFSYSFAQFGMYLKVMWITPQIRLRTVNFKAKVLSMSAFPENVRLKHGI